MYEKDLAPICLFVHDRINKTKMTIDSLKMNNLASKSELFIFSDGWSDKVTRDKIIELRVFLKEINGFRKITIIESSINKGLANSVINGVTKVLKDHDKVIVLEDDLITTINFLNFMNESLHFYKDCNEVQSISGYSLKINNKTNSSDVYFHKRAHSWSWATWKNNWNEVIFDKEKLKNELSPEILKSFSNSCGEDISEMLQNSIKGINDSWYVRWAYDHFKKGNLSVYPFYSKVKNIGFSSEGTNCNGIDVSISELDNQNKTNFLFTNPDLNENVNKDFLRYFSKSYKLKFRLNLLTSSKGRKSLFNEIKNRIFNGK